MTPEDQRRRGLNRFPTCQRSQGNGVGEVGRPGPVGGFHLGVAHGAPGSAIAHNDEVAKARPGWQAL